MCGIAGRVNFTSRRPVDPVLIADMCVLQAHRGPDGQGVWCDGPVGLGHRRLAIIDLSDAARQPMSTPDGRFTITYNGEIYNFRELREELETHGHRFRTRSDTEVLLHLYQQYGIECLARLRGMFAFAIWDATDRTLLLARDRLGKKPLVYRLDREGLEFASEPKAFLANPSFQPEAAPVALAHYLAYQYVPAPYSAFRGVQKLPPGHFLLLSHDAPPSVQRYWKLRYQPKRRLTERQAADELVSLLEESVRLRLISDVPLGAFLSGGIDSGTIVALMSRIGAGRVKTFSIGFEEPEYNELPFARLVAERYATDHHEFVVRPDAVAILPRLVWHYNEPYADSSAIPTYYLAELTRRHVTVALNGDAGDENFAGYDRYLAAKLARRFDRVMPGAVRGAAGALGRAMRRGVRTRTLRSRAGRLLEGLAAPAHRRYAHWLFHFHPPMFVELVTPEFRRQIEGCDVYGPLDRTTAESDAPDPIDALLDLDVNTYLPDDLLVKVDIATMAHGLEGRAPLVDHRVMEFAAGLPSGLKLRGRTTKYLLKRVARDLLPAEVVARPKMGFGVPLERWFRHELRELAYDVLLGSRARERGCFNPEFVRALLDDHTSGRRPGHYQVWNLLVFELWHRMFIDERPTTAPTPTAVPDAARVA